MDYRNRNTALVLCFFLGLLGAHWFYLGKPTWGGIYLCAAIGTWPAALWLSLGFAIIPTLGPALGAFVVVVAVLTNILLAFAVLYDFFCLLSILPVEFNRQYNQ